MARILDAAESPRRKPASSTCIHDGVALVCTQEGTPKGVLANAIAMLRYSPEWLGVLGFNQFSLYAVTRKPAPWPQSKAGDNWTDSDDCRAAEWLQQHSVIVSSRVTAEAVQVIAEENRFHPVREYLSSLKWDGKPRLATWLLDYLGAPDIPFTRAVGTRWLVSAVARIFQPDARWIMCFFWKGRRAFANQQGCAFSPAMNGSLTISPTWVLKIRAWTFTASGSWKWRNSIKCAAENWKRSKHF